MTADDARSTVQHCLEEVAPGAGGDVLAPDADLREALDLDSMDLFNLVAAIADRTGIDIPDRDVSALRTIDDFAGFLVAVPGAGR